jgi:hypothetical protein
MGDGTFFRSLDRAIYLNKETTQHREKSHGFCKLSLFLATLK